MTMMKLPQHWLKAGSGDSLSKSLFRSIKNKPCFLKPEGGLWLSPYHSKRKFKSPWLEWCYYNDFGNYDKAGVIVTLPNNTKIFTINSQADLIDFIYEVGVNSEEKWFTYWKIPDFENAAKMFDGIYLTEKGQRDTHIPWNNPEFTLYGWDSSSLLLLNWKIKSQRPIILDPHHSPIPEEKPKAETCNFVPLQKAEA